MNSAGTAAQTVQKGHPKGLYYLFFTEMWERYSYYGMRSLLVYYMMKQLMFAQDRASSIYGLYTGFVYFTPFFGGLLADRVLGQRKTVIIGGILMALGQFMLMSEALFFPALFMMVLGNGAFKPNISTQVGSLYEKGDPRRDKAFSIFYVGINVGALLAPFIPGTIGELYGWRYGFMVAGIGMLIGLVVYLMGQKHLAPDNVMKQKAAQKTAPQIKPEEDKLTPEERAGIIALCVLLLFNIVFWAVYEQQGNTLAVWVDSYTDRNILGWEMPAVWFQSFNPIMITIFTPFIIALWSWQNRRGKEPSSIAKMATGCVILGASFLVLIPASWEYAVTGKASLWWLVLSTAIATTGELYLSPVGLSLVTKIAKPRMVSMLMGMWFLSSFFGNYLCGYIGTFFEKMSKENFFLMLASLGIAAGLGMFILLKPIKNAMSRGRPGAVDL